MGMFTSKNLNRSTGTSCNILPHSSTPSPSNGAINPDYYWKDYTGKIPFDAFIAGQDKESFIYIGQAYRPNVGIIPVQITPGSNKVQTYIFNDVQETDTGIKILCGPQDNFEWLLTDGTSHLKNVSDKNPVLGGFDSTGDYQVGRTEYEGRLKVGKIAVASPDGNAIRIYFADNGSERDSESYEVLVFDKKEMSTESSETLKSDDCLS